MHSQLPGLLPGVVESLAVTGVQMRPLSTTTLALAMFAVTGPLISAGQPIGPSCPDAGAIPVRFVSAVSASSFRADDGREIRLAGVIGPGEGDAATPENIGAARAALGSVLSGQRLSLAITGSPDRYQRVNAQVFADGVWVQEMMLRQGLLRVAPDRQAGACVASMLTAEDTAISSKAGDWGDGRYRIRTPDQVTKSAGRFETVEGEVWRTQLVQGRETIEFSNASSFQLNILPEAARALRNAGIDVRRLRGRVIRVRGWVGLDNRPVMEISTPGALEVIGKAVRRR